AGAGLLGLAARPGLAAAGASARPVGRAQVHLAREAAGALVVLDARDHRVRAAGLVPVPGLVRRARLGMAVAMALARGGLGLGRQQRLGGGALGLEPGGLLFLALALGFLGAALVLFGQALLLGQVALARFLQLAQDLGALVVHRPRLRGGSRRLLRRLHQGDLLAHHHVHGVAVLAAAHRELLLAAAAQ